MRHGYRDFVRELLVVMVVALIISILVSALGGVKAQDAGQLYACRTDRSDLVEIQFHNFQPTLGLDYWYLGDAGYVDPDRPNVLVVQALTAYQPVAGAGPDAVDEINHIRNGMAIVGNQDYSIEMVGLPETPRCGEGAWYATMSGSDFSLLPDQVQLTPEVAQAQVRAPVQVAAQQPTTCQFLEIDFYTNQITCH